MIKVIKRGDQYVLKFFKTGPERSQKFKRNVFGSTIIKLAQMLIELIKVPILLSYLDSEKYGVWLTITSILLWTHQFDLGLTAGLRYKLTESIALGNNNRGKNLVSTAFVSMAVIMLTVFLILSTIFSQLNWTSVLNVHIISNKELLITILSVFALFVIQFVVDIISVVLKADQRAAVSDIFKPLGSFLSLLVILVLKVFTKNSLFIASIAMSVPYLLLVTVANFYFFSNKYNIFKPSIKCFKLSLVKDIYSLGFKMFLGQLSALVVFTTANILISRALSPSDVTIYTIARTYFTFMSVFMTIMLVPFAAATTDAFIKDDISWIKKGIRRLQMASLLLTIGCIFMFCVYNFAIHLWVGDKVIIPWQLGFAFVICTILDLWSTPYIEFLGGVGKLSFRMYLSIFKIITFIPTAWFAMKSYGVVGMVLATILVNALPNLVFSGIQYKLIINKTARGIWGR